MEKMNGNFKNISKWLFAVIFISFFLEAGAQCTLGCNNPFPAMPLSVAVDTNCEAEITADLVLEGPGSCPGPKFLEVRTLSGFLVISGVEPVKVPGAYLGTTLRVTVIDINTGNNCSGHIALTDNLEPMFAPFSCQDTVVSCVTDTNPDVFGYPVVFDNCDNDVSLAYTQTQTTPNCSGPSPYISVITRTWIATDDSGNQNTCTQTISLAKAGIEDVVFPANVTQSCSNPNTHPDVTGWPSIGGVPIMPGNLCMYSTAYTDVTALSCAPATHSYVIIRTWTVVNGCSTPTQTFAYQQNISVADGAGPTVTCQPVITVSSNTNTCTGTFFLPPASASDNCSAPGNISISVLTSFGGSGLGPHFDIPVGSYTVTYTGIDECNNISTCVSTLNIVDDAVPVAVCDEITTVSLTSAGIAIVPAAVLDDGSYDNCGPVSFTGSLDGGVTFSSNLTFTCADVGLPVNVIVRVSSLANPASFSSCSVIVNVTDKLPPALLCPPNQTIDCIETFPIDLSAFGQPVVGDNCGFTLIADSTFNLSNCGEGMILRSFTATDPSGNSVSCTQTLTVQNLTPFNGALIQWPADYTVLNGCIQATELDPDDLPSSPVNLSAPVLPNINCSLLAANYSDQVFFIAYPACYKIIRTWTVMDWCAYNPYNPGQGGIWYHTQVIKVEDNIAPVFGTLPPDTVRVGVGANCGFGAVNLSTVTATDCSPSITISNNSPYANANGANASGMYPLGQTQVKFGASDGCGNMAIHTIVVIVEDVSPPSVVCQSLVIEMATMQGGVVSASINAQNLLVATADNCTAKEDLGVFIRRRDPNAVGPPSETSLTFFCGEQGLKPVEVWVVDEAGNADFCIVNVDVQDNFVLCPPLAVYTIAGVVETESGHEVDGVEVLISGSVSAMQMGSPFVFSNQPGGYDYTVLPNKDEELTNGVTTYDLVLISRHILGVQPLNTPYKIIAADANRSGLVTTLDMVLIRRAILGMSSEFPGNTSWRFVDKAYAFPNPADPFSHPFQEVISINNLNTDLLFADFVAIKVGDVNGTASPNLMTDEMEERQFEGVLRLYTEDLFLERGQRYEIPVYGYNFEDILGAQFTLGLAPGALEWQGAGSCELPELGPDNFGESPAAEGQIAFSWHTGQGATMRPGECLFTIHINALQTGNLRDWLTIGSGRLQAEAYRGDGAFLGVSLQTGLTPADGLQLYQNRPNPFDRSTTIGFSVGKPTRGALVIYDLSGKEVYRQTGTWAPGYYEWTIDREQLPASGMYYYKLETDAVTEVRKMILID